MDEDKKLKPTYAGTFDEQLSDLYDRIQNREDFSYDMKADPLYQQYKDSYVRQGKLAMKDTMGQAAALTGGYGSSYGQQVGQQAYDSYLQKLGDVVPELYSAAYQRYRDDGNDLLTQYGLVGQQRDTEYSRYRDALGDYNYDQELARRDEETAYNRRISEDETAYRRQQQAYSNLYALIAATGYSPSEDELTAAGMPRSVADALRAKYQEMNTPPEQRIVYVNNTKSNSSSGSGAKNTLDSDVGALKSAGLSSIEINRFISQATAKGGEYGGTSAQEKARIRAKYGATAR